MIQIIVAYDKNRVIGNKGNLPWSIPSDLRHFKEITLGGVLIMGRKTYESIGKPLENRFTIVISKTKNFSFENCITVSSFSEALLNAKKIINEKKLKDDIFVCGGNQVYQEALPYVGRIIATEIDGVFEGDVFFPQISEKDFYVSDTSEIIQDGNISYKILTYKKKSK